MRLRRGSSLGEQETESDDDADGGESGQDALHVIAPQALLDIELQQVTVSVDRSQCTETAAGFTGSAQNGIVTLRLGKATNQAG